MLFIDKSNNITINIIMNIFMISTIIIFIIISIIIERLKINKTYACLKSKTLCICRFSSSCFSLRLFWNIREFEPKKYFADYRTVNTIHLFAPIKGLVVTVQNPLASFWTVTFSTYESVCLDYFRTVTSETILIKKTNRLLFVIIIIPFTLVS